ncbi:MAG: pdxH [Marmoricola sp.]|nr:pdxH [Marmoricola sp.]
MDPVTPDLASLREEYELGGLDESDLTPDPLELFSTWFEIARAAGITEPNAMVLSTVDAGGAPSSRTVLLKGFDARGFVFFTNHESRKGVALAADPRCSLLFGWYGLQRQVRIEGTADVVRRSETDAYFASRPRDSQIGAWASAQSREVASRETLEATYDEIRAYYLGQDIPAPPYWGGYRVRPSTIEFWQGRRGRMHDRLVYRRTGETWSTHRLAP